MFTRQQRAVEVQHRQRIMHSAGSRGINLTHYCVKCQQANIIAWRIFETMMNEVIIPETYGMNIDLKVIHRVLLGYFTVDGNERVTAGQRVQEHVIEAYSHDKGEYLMNAGIQIKFPTRRHLRPCQYVIVLVDIPYRKFATSIVWSIGELTMLRVKEVLQTINIEGMTLIDRRDAHNVMEYRFRTILGSTSVPMGPDQGFERMTSLRHMRELPVDDRTPRSNVGGLPDIDSEVPAVVVMEVDNEGSQEAQQ